VMSQPIRLRWTNRAIAWFALGGAIGPLLVLVLRYVDYDAQFYRPLYALISVLCPAWLLGPLEYSYGAVATWLIIFVTNVLIWSVLGAIVALGRRGHSRLIAFAAVCILAVVYAYWISESTIAILGLLVMLATVFLASRERVNAGDA
jgi:hypothetical protein